MRDIVKPALILFLICLFVTGALAYTNSITEGKIEEQRILNEEKAKKEVLPIAEAFEEIQGIDGVIASNENLSPVEKAYKGVKGGVPAGYVFLVSTKGYGGDLKLMVGIDSEGKISGVKIMEMKETPGLGSKAVDEPFKSQLSGFIPREPLKVVKGVKATKDEEIEAISGATVTSRAVTRGLQTAIDMAAELAKKEGR